MKIVSSFGVGILSLISWERALSSLDLSWLLAENANEDTGDVSQQLFFHGWDKSKDLFKKTHMELEWIHSVVSCCSCCTASGYSLTHMHIVENKPNLKKHAANTFTHARRPKENRLLSALCSVHTHISHDNRLQASPYSWSLLTSISPSRSISHKLKIQFELSSLKWWGIYSYDTHIPLLSDFI